MICFLDPGRHLGVLRAPLRDKTAIVHNVTLLTRKLRDTTDLGAFLRSADDPIREAIQGVDEVWVEAPNTQGQNHHGIVKNVALYGLICYWACHESIPVRPFNLRHAKLSLTDNGNAKKPDMIRAAEFQLALPAGTLSEHEADVLGGWMVASYGVPPNAGERQKAAVAKRRAEKAAQKASLSPVKDSLL